MNDQHLLARARRATPAGPFGTIPETRSDPVAHWAGLPLLAAEDRERIEQVRRGSLAEHVVHTSTAVLVFSHNPSGAPGPAPDSRPWGYVVREVKRTAEPRGEGVPSAPTFHREVPGAASQSRRQVALPLAAMLFGCLVTAFSMSTWLRDEQSARDLADIRTALQSLQKQIDARQDELGRRFDTTIQNWKPSKPESPIAVELAGAIKSVSADADFRKQIDDWIKATVSAYVGQDLGDIVKEVRSSFSYVSSQITGIWKTTPGVKDAMGAWLSGLSDQELDDLHYERRGHPPRARPTPEELARSMREGLRRHWDELAPAARMQLLDELELDIRPK